VSSVTVGDVFVDQRAFSRSRVLFAVLDGSLNCQDIHAVDLQTRNILAPLVVISDGRRAVGGGAHAVLVV